MLAWIGEKLAGGFASVGFKLFGSTILQPILNAWANHENIDLEKFRAAAKSTSELAGAVLQANVQFAATKARYALRVLQWWPFRALLLVLLGVSAIHYTAVILDSTPFPTLTLGPWLLPEFGEPHVVGSWGVPTPPPPYDEYEREFLLFFIIAKPVETVASQALRALSAYLERR